MPITQKRLLALIDAVEHYQLAFDALADQAMLYVAAVRDGKLTLEKAFNDLAMDLQYRPPTTRQADNVQSRERTRYNLTHARNDRDRAAKERQRLGITRLPEDRQRDIPTIERLIAKAEREREAGIVPRHRQSPAPAPDTSGAKREAPPRPRTAAEIAAAVDSEDTSMFGDSDVQAWTPHKSDGEDNK
jgi:hypothetical protein